MHGHWLKDYIGPKASAQGGGGSEPFIVTLKSSTLDKTWREIHDTIVSGRTVLVTHDKEQGDGSDPNVYTALSVYVTANKFRVILVTNGSGTPAITPYDTTDIDGYPRNNPL